MTFHGHLVIVDTNVVNNEFISWDFCLQGHLQLAAFHRVNFLGRPGHKALLLTLFHNPSKHSDVATHELPDHPPKVIHDGLESALSSNVGIAHLLALTREKKQKLCEYREAVKGI